MSIRLKLSLVLISLFVISIGNTVFTFVLENFGEEKLRWVNHTHQVINETEQLLSTMTDAETGQRGYLLTGDLSYLEPYYTGLIAAENHFKVLFKLTSDNPVQQKRLTKVKEFIQKKFEELNHTIEVMQKTEKKDNSEALRIVKQNTGKQYMDAIRRHLIAFKNEERVLLEARKGDYRENKAYIITVVGFELMFFIIMGAFTILFVRRNLFVPMEMLLKNTSKMEKGEKQNISDLLPNDEMGYLLSRFYQMSEIVYDKTKLLTFSANHDELTGLKNRAKMREEIYDSIVGVNKTGAKMAVFFIDLNKFKQLNDTLGHDAGDAVLKETAKRLEESVRSDDLVFRQGGDEFLIVLKNINEVSDAKNIVINIIKRFEPPVMFQGKSIEISLSIGIAISPDDTADSEEIIKFSDVAMYVAKNDKETDYKFFNRSMLKRISDT
ncbi:MAG: diguanylate cyclase [Desulfobacteraceae bacterium]|nr:diguanylate cyclase [Desulfobacteraceae bacterium]